MDAATNKITLEIKELINRLDSIRTSYNKEVGYEISEDLQIELQFFCTRVKYISQNVPKVDTRFSPTIKQFEYDHVSNYKNPIKKFQDGIIAIKSYLITTQKELENGLLYDVEELISVDYFDSHVEQAKKLLSKKYKDAAAVIMGGVLEDKLRQLSKKNNLPLKDEKDRFLMMENLNQNLYKKGIYNLNIQKRIIEVSGIRNDAAHGKFDNYTLSQVKSMVDFIEEFIDEQSL